MHRIWHISIMALLMLPPPILAAESGQPLPLAEQWSGNAAGETIAKRVIVRDQEDWDKLWAEIKGPVIPTQKAAKIDFQKYMLVGVFLGTRPTGGYAVAIQRVEENGQITVVLRQREPQPGEVTTQALTSPYSVVAVPRSNKAVRFVVEKEQPNQ
jgi:hypothetical protein